jgi:hypothetical protein
VIELAVVGQLVCHHVLLYPHWCENESPMQGYRPRLVLLPPPPAAIEIADCYANVMRRKLGPEPLDSLREFLPDAVKVLVEDGLMLPRELGLFSLRNTDVKLSSGKAKLWHRYLCFMDHQRMVSAEDNRPFGCWQVMNLQSLNFVQINQLIKYLLVTQIYIFTFNKLNRVCLKYDW